MAPVRGAMLTRTGPDGAGRARAQQQRSVRDRTTEPVADTTAPSGTSRPAHRVSRLLRDISQVVAPPRLPAHPGEHGRHLTAGPTFGTGLIQRCGGMPEPCPCHDGEDQEHSSLQRHPGPAGRGAASSGIPATVGDVLRTPGQPLPRSVRSWVERAFDAGLPPGLLSPVRAAGQRKSALSTPGDAGEREADAAAARVTAAGLRGGMASGPSRYHFSDVRVHTDPAAGRAAEALGASAFTSGRHIVFAPRAFDPASPSGRRLLAHELAHVVQQRRGTVRPG